MLIITAEQLGKLTGAAREALPNEACGLLAGEICGEEKIVREVYPLKNTDESPEHFSMAPEDQFAVIADVRKKGLALLGNFHSHPATPARPSAEDLRLAFDPSLTYMIISLAGNEPVVKTFTVKNGAAAEEAIRVEK
ncbi:MAG: M67 family metallopeptidase [Spirochaetaceae bacterium]|jgi:proteasome lid subunit RPN8/RPN11|nr:M67 family metallopeptidase [Spirochaetaceae bacterium]